MGDLGLHALHMPLRAGWKINNVRAILSNVVTERPDDTGAPVPCETWDNATLLCEAEAPVAGEEARNSGLRGGVGGDQHRLSARPRHSPFLSLLHKKHQRSGPPRLQDGVQNWQTIDIGHKVTFPSIIGGIFEFGFSDAILQMWAAFMAELDGNAHASRFARSGEIDEAGVCHRLFTAAPESQRTGGTATV